MTAAGWKHLGEQMERDQGLVVTIPQRGTYVSER